MQNSNGFNYLGTDDVFCRQRRDKEIQKFEIVGIYGRDHSLESSRGALSDGMCHSFFNATISRGKIHFLNFSIVFVMFLHNIFAANVNLFIFHSIFLKKMRTFNGTRSMMSCLCE
jgi:hypothetical protein